MSFKINFKSLLNKDYSSLNHFKHLQLNDIDFFVYGNIYNCSDVDLLNTYFKTGLNCFKNIDGEYLIIIVHNNKLHFRSFGYLHGWKRNSRKLCKEYSKCWEQ